MFIDIEVVLFISDLFSASNRTSVTTIQSNVGKPRGDGAANVEVSDGIRSLAKDVQSIMAKQVANSSAIHTAVSRDFILIQLYFNIICAFLESCSTTLPPSSTV